MKPHHLALHRALEEEGPVPSAYLIARICQEFHCTPSVAMREWENLPCGFIEEIIEARAYAEAKAMYDRAEKKDDLPDTSLMRLIMENDFALAKEKIDARRAAQKAEAGE